MPTFYVVDVETTGNEPDDEVIELGLTVMNQHGVEDTFEQLCKPRHKKISLEAKSVHHISDQDLSGKPEFDHVFKNFMTNNGLPMYFVAHNAAYEQQFIKTDIPWICTMKCAMVLAPNAEKFSNQYLRYYFNIIYNDILLQYVNRVHRAGPDSRVTADILAKLLEIASVERLVKISQDIQRPPRIPFGKHAGSPWSSIPFSYLRWMVGPNDLDADIKQVAREEMQRRGSF